MKTIVPALIALVLLLPLSSSAQTILSFPHVVDAPDLSTAGWALVNPGTSDATATFTLFGGDGAILGSSPQLVKAGGQVAKTGGQLFTARAAGWVQITSDTTGLQGFSFGGDLSTFEDGAEAATSASELVLPLTGSSSEVHVANTGGTDVTILINLLGADGFELDQPFPQLIRTKGFFRGNIATMFPKANPTQATHMRLKCGCTNASQAFAAQLVVRDFLAAPSLAFLNAVPVSSRMQKLVFPSLVDGTGTNAAWKSVITVTNLSTTLPNDVTIIFTPDNGTALPAVQRQLAPNGTIRETAQQMFGFTGYQSGWIGISSASALPITGYVAYAETVNGAMTIIAGQSDSQTNLLFSHIADLPPWSTGLALLNPNSPAIVQVFAINQDGTLIGSAQFNLGAFGKTTKPLSEWIPATQTRAIDGGFVFVRSNFPLFGIEVFFSRNGQVIANVPAGKPGAYTPPSQ